MIHISVCCMDTNAESKGFNRGFALPWSPHLLAIFKDAQLICAYRKRVQDKNDDGTTKWLTWGRGQKKEENRMEKDIIEREIQMKYAADFK